LCNIDLMMAVMAELVANKAKKYLVVFSCVRT